MWIMWDLLHKSKTQIRKSLLVYMYARLEEPLVCDLEKVWAK